MVHPSATNSAESHAAIVTSTGLTKQFVLPSVPREWRARAASPSRLLTRD
jgi:hypothetical protein